MSNKPRFSGEWVKLGELCDICSGGTPKRSIPEYWSKGSIPWVKISDIANKYVSSTEERITEEGLRNSSAKMLAPGTLLYSIFASIGSVGILEIPAATNQAIAGLSIKTDRLEQTYLYHFLKSQEAFAKTSGRGAAQNNINLTILRGMKVPLPSIDDQRSIVERLDEVEIQIERATAQLDQLDALVKSQFVEMFGNASYPNKRLDEVASVKGGLTKSAKREKLPLKLPYLRVANVLSGKLDLSEMKEIGLSQAEVEKVLLKAGDLLFVEGNGSGDQIGRAAIWNGEIEPCVHQNHLIRARCSGQLMPVYALHYFMSPGGRDQIVTKAVSTSGLFTLSTGKIKSLELPVPPLALQQQFANFVARVDKSQSIAQQQIEKLQTLYDSLAQEYFS